jgi:mannose-1-phosphate guanylyltransferase
MLNHFYAVIMAGGGGTRLWPLSRQERPKQMLHLIGERSLFQIAVQRLDGVFPPERILVVTVAAQADELRRQAPELPAENFLLEPMPRGTASVIGLAAVVLSDRDPQAVMAVLTSDHFIGNEDKFKQLLRAGFQAASHGHLVTLGIKPTYPATGYGYIQRGDHIRSIGDIAIYHALRFKEKPAEKQAISMLDSGQYAWNSGMFVWQVNQIIDEFGLQMPELSTRLKKISQAWNTPDSQDVLDREWFEINTQTIDYGIMEGARNVVVIPAEGLEWSDVGSWDSLFNVLNPDQDGNIILGAQTISIDTNDSLVIANQEDRLVVTVGIEDLVVVDTGDVLLVCRKGESQKVRQIVDQLKQAGQSYL